MKNILKHIVIAAVIIISAACSREEFTPLHKGQNVEFILRQTGFNGFDVAASETKALTNDQLTELETRIHSLYFLVFDASGNRREFKSLATDITSQTLYHNYSNGPLTVCYLANVPQAYAESIDHTDDFADVPLDGISYTYDKTSNGDFVVIPQIGGVQCIPMFGKVAYPGAAVGESVVQIPLERLFAKVVVSLKADLSDASWGVDFNPPSIELESFSVDNLPEKVALQEALATDGTIIRESGWARASDAFADPLGTVFDPILTVSDDGINLGGISLSGFTKVISCYIPEYALTPSSSNTANDQKLKPTFCPSDKHPVFLTFKGVAKQDKMVDVPLEYFIHFGENPYDSFSLRRNTQYDNNLTIKGTLDAVLETDKRVDATYHNLADPLNTGSDNPANCYIISKPGRYLIPTYVGNDVNQLLSGRSAEVLTLNGSTNNRIDNVECVTIDGKNFIQFDLNMFDTAGNTALTDVAGGNKLLVLKNANGQIIWSWHLWLCEDGNRPDEYHHTYPSTGFTVMNRAIGATQYQGFELLGYSLSQWFDGLYYQWGRKDPLLPSGNTVASSATYAKSIQNPRLYYTDWKGTYTAENSTDAIGWTSSKSVNDPCPPGYKVPSTGIWRSSANNSDGLESIMEQMGFDGYPYNLQTTGGLAGNIVYPYSSHIANGSVAPFTPTPYSASVKDRQLATGLYTTIYFSGEKYLYSGELWSSDGGLYFGRHKQTINDGAQIFIHLDISLVDRWFPANPSENTDGYTIGNIQDSLLNSVGKIAIIGSLAKRTLQSLLNGLGVSLDEIAKGILESFMTVNHEYDPKLKTDNDAIPVSHGAHVRCVREDSPVL